MIEKWKDVFIHIRMQKCGTTTLQGNFFPQLNNVKVASKNIRVKSLPGFINGNHKLLISDENLAGIPGINNEKPLIEKFEESLEALSWFFPNAKSSWVLENMLHFLIHCIGRFCLAEAYWVLKVF